MAQGTPVISLKQDFDPTELTIIQLQQNYYDGTKEKMGTPIIDGRSIEANLYGLHEFRETAEELTFDTGDELFTYFRRILRGTINDDWDTTEHDNGLDQVNDQTRAVYEVIIHA